MVKKLQKNKPAKAAGIHLSGSVKDSAQQIWQAGLGAFTRAQAEGSKAFESLVKEGVSIQRKTQAAAEGKISEATTKMSTMATDISTKASGQWDKLENIFEERVAKALNKLGVPSAKDVAALISRIDELNKAVQKLSTKSPAAAAKAPPQSLQRRSRPPRRPQLRPLPALLRRSAAAKAARKATAKPAAKAVKKAAAKRAKPPLHLLLQHRSHQPKPRKRFGSPLRHDHQGRLCALFCAPSQPAAMQQKNAAPAIYTLTTMTAPQSTAPKIALALAGGGPLGAIYEVGAMCALEESLLGLDFNQLAPLRGCFGRWIHCGGLGQRHDATRPVCVLHRKRWQPI